MSIRCAPICKDPNVAKHLFLLHDKYAIISADKAPNNIVFVFKSHYIECLIKELGIDNSLGNPTYTPTTLTKEEILDNHRSFLWNFNQRWRTGSTITLLVSYITQVSFQTALYCLVCQMLHKTSFQIIYMSSIGGQNRAELLWQSRVVWIRCRFWRTLKMC